ncbi:acyltransferase [Candidatus Daviesbacteria bacterium]|nr:acyltransferase [Candidatus Daviesbacteria bacterium]
MLIKVSDPVFQTVLLTIFFLCLLLVSIKRIKEEGFLSKKVTNQLKGFAILAIIFGHIGYFLSSDTKFLYPLSVLSGTGVNLFLFLSGLGLTVSNLQSPLPVLSFYKKRLFKLFIPLWIAITLILLADFFLLHRTYPIREIVYSFLGFYPRADLWQNLDSPLWYFSVIIFYYLIFPLLFIRKIPLISPLLVLLVSLFILNLSLPVDRDVLKLYKLHTLAFPLGMLFGLLIQHLKFKLHMAFKILALLIAVATFLYTAIHSGVGQDPKIEQGISLITAFSAVIIFALSGWEFKLFSFFGLYSYEIYLLHWPILSRFNPFLQLPPFLTVILNLVFFILFAYTLQKLFLFLQNKRGYIK